MTCTTCPYCGVGCGLNIQTLEDRIVSVSGDDAHPANKGRICIKGAHLADARIEDERLLYPSIGGRRVSWMTAIDKVARGFQQVIEQHGPDAVALYLSGQLLTEDYYVANKLMKGFIGSANVDTNSRLCMASAVAGYKRAFGEDVVPCEYDDLEHCDLIVLVGSNAAWTHPVLFQRIAKRRELGEVTVVVIDPRETQTSDIADLHLKLRPGSDVALFNGLLNYLDKNGGCNQRYIEHSTRGFSEALDHARRASGKLCATTGLTRQQLDHFYRLFLDTPRVVTFFSQGVNQSRQGTDKVNSIINCHLATGRIGVRGAGPFSITGQPNAMGGREVGGMANQIAAHMGFEADDIARVSRYWDAPNVVHGPGLNAVNLFEAVADGRIRAIWIMGTNPAVSLPDSARVRAALKACPFVVVSDCMRTTDTAQFADVLLPAQGWGEKDGTVTNSERCLSRQRGFLSAPGEARPDWRIVCDVALSMGYAQAFDYRDVFEIFNEHVGLTAYENDGRRVLDLGHLHVEDRTAYDSMGASLWPRNGRPFASGLFSTNDRRARFVGVEQLPQNFPHPGEGELILNTGRLRDQWHTMTRTGYASKLFNQTRLPYLDIHPHDAERRGIEEADLVDVHSAVGRARYLARITTRQTPGQVFAPIHWTDQFARNACVSNLVPVQVDPVSGQPESKFALVSVYRTAVARWVGLLSRKRDAPQMARQLSPEFWCMTPVGEFWYCIIGLADERRVFDLLAMDDAVVFQHAGAKRLLGRRNGVADWIAFVEDHARALPTAESLQAKFCAGLPDWQKLAAVALSDGDTSRIVCSCYDVSEDRIRGAIKRGCGSVTQLGAELSCGQNCGSCVAEIETMLSEATLRVSDVG